MNRLQYNTELNLTVKRLFEVFRFSTPVIIRKKRKNLIRAFWTSDKETPQEIAVDLLTKLDNAIKRWKPKGATEISLYKSVNYLYDGTSQRLVVLDNKKDMRMFPCPIAVSHQDTLGNVCADVFIGFNKNNKSLWEQQCLKSKDGFQLDGFWSNG